MNISRPGPLKKSVPTQDKPRAILYLDRDGRVVRPSRYEKDVATARIVETWNKENDRFNNDGETLVRTFALEETKTHDTMGEPIWEVIVGTGDRSPGSHTEQSLLELLGDALTKEQR